MREFLRDNDKESMYLFLSIFIMVGMFFYMFWAYTTQIPSGDELVFLRVTDNLPSYESKMEWWTLDGKTDPNTFLEPSAFYKLNYTLPVWQNPPLDSYLSWPLVKLFFNEDTNTDIAKSVHLFRFFALLMVWFCIASMIFLIRRHNKSNKVLFFSLLPLLATIPFYTKWIGMNWWYYDIFTFTFLCIALLMRKTKYEKFIYIPLCLMVASKLVGFLFIIPFAIENKKTVWCALAIVPFLIQCWVVSGDPLYIVHVWEQHENLVVPSLEWKISDSAFISFFINRIYYITIGVQKALLLVLVVAISFVDYIRQNTLKLKENWFLPLLFLSAFVYGFGLEAYYYHMIVVMLVGILISGIVVAQRQKVRVYD